MIGVLARAAARTVLPERWRVPLRRLRRQLHIPLAMGDLRRVTPFSRIAGFDRGQPIDRYYIQQFLAEHAPDVRGRVLEIGDDRYTRQFGGDRVTRSEVLHVVPGNPLATLVADLTCADAIPAEAFDCIIATQTLQMIYDIRAAVRHLHRILKPGGILLVTSAGISGVYQHEDRNAWGEYWHLTSQSALHLFREFFPSDDLLVRAYGNVLSAAAFLYGLAAGELHQEELDYRDEPYEVLIAVRAAKGRWPLPPGPVSSQAPAAAVRELSGGKRNPVGR